MYNIPKFYQLPHMTTEQATSIMKDHAEDGQLITGMLEFQAIWKEHIDTRQDKLDVSFFMTKYFYESNAFNLLYEGLSTLFVGTDYPGLQDNTEDFINFLEKKDWNPCSIRLFYAYKRLTDSLDVLL